MNELAKKDGNCDKLSKKDGSDVQVAGDRNHLLEIDNMEENCGSQFSDHGGAVEIGMSRNQPSTSTETQVSRIQHTSNFDISHLSLYELPAMSPKELDSITPSELGYHTSISPVSPLSTSGNSRTKFTPASLFIADDHSSLYKLPGRIEEEEDHLTRWNTADRRNSWDENDRDVDDGAMHIAIRESIVAATSDRYSAVVCEAEMARLGTSRKA